MTRPVLPPSLADRAATLPSLEEGFEWHLNYLAGLGHPHSGSTDEAITEARQALARRRAELQRGRK